MNRNNLKDSLTSVLSLMCDIMLLNILWLFCSLPIITIGPATCALFSCMLKIARDELGESTLKTFFRAFKENFKFGFFYGIIALAAAVIIVIDITYALAQEGTVRTVFLVVSGVAGAIWLTFTAYVFPLQARYENTFVNQIRNAFLIAACTPGRTLIMWAIYAIPVTLILVLPLEVVLQIGFLFLMCGMSLPAYFNCRILRKIFEKFVENEVNEENTQIE